MQCSTERPDGGAFCATELGPGSQFGHGYIHVSCEVSRPHGSEQASLEEVSKTAQVFSLRAVQPKTREALAKKS